MTKKSVNKRRAEKLQQAADENADLRRQACSTGPGGQARGSGCVFRPCGSAHLIPLGWSSRFLPFTCSAGSFFFRCSELFFCCVCVSSLTGSGTGGKGRRRGKRA
ncbi:unnamed protein product [Pylaiella littoralis]